MNNKGIVRVNIINDANGAGAWRFLKAKKRWPAANRLYRKIFDTLNMPLSPGEGEIRCTPEEFEAGYDKDLGVDVIFRFKSGMEATLQEKFLFTRFKTVTVEYMQNWRIEEPGDWFHMKAQYYFVGYDRTEAYTFQDWILLDWAAVQRATNTGTLRWEERRNRKDGAQASFKFAQFDAFPRTCIVANST